MYSSTEISNLGQAALDYANKGYRVFPLAPRSKKPRFKDWPWRDVASSNPEDIQRWWRDYPDSNIGLVADDHTIIDVDQKNGHDGWAAVGSLIDQNTFWVQTPNDGWHFYYQKSPEHLKKTEGVDIQTGLKYVVAPPSVLPEGPYVARAPLDTPLKPVPPALVEKLKGPPVTASDAAMPALLEMVPPMPLENLKPFQATFCTTGEIADAGELGDQSRSGVVMSLAGTLYRLGYDDSQVLSMLWNNSYVQETGTEHRQGDYQGGLDWLWLTCRKVRQKETGEVFSPIEGASVVVERRNLYQLRSFAELAAEARVPEWTIDGYLPETGVGILFGPPGSWKSFLMFDMAAAVATGQPFHGHEVVSPGPVVYLAGEGDLGLYRRVSGLAKVRGFDTKVPIYVSGQVVPLMESTQGFDPVFGMLDQIQEREGKPPRLIVVDTLSKHLDGDENSSKDVSAFLNRMDEIRDRYGCMIMVVHHTGHATSDRARGSSALRANVDLEFSLIPEENGHKVSLLKCEKMKDDEPPAPLAFTASKVVLEHMVDHKGRPKDTLVLSVVADYQSNADKGRADNRTQVETLCALQECMGEDAILQHKGVTIRDLYGEVESRVQERGGKMVQYKSFRRRILRYHREGILVVREDLVRFPESITKVELPFQPLSG